MADNEITKVSRSGKPYNKRGFELIRDRSLNRGSSFTSKERHNFGIRGLLPPRPVNQYIQVERVLHILKTLATDIERYHFLMTLQNRNEELFYAVVQSDLPNAVPILYTPTVGEACETFSQTYQRASGLFISIDDRGHMDEIFQNYPEDDIRVVVVTDGERILGLGDQGINGAPIPAGKLVLYTVCGGVSPRHCLPITLDVGTNNKNNLMDPFYLGLQHERVRGKEYDEFIEEFVTALYKRYPHHVLLQFEDFGNVNAFRLLENYREKVCCFNDDMQGTASVTLSGVLSGLRVTKGALTDQKILFLGAGEAGIGIGDLICSAMQEEGLSLEEARKRICYVDSQGLVCKSRIPSLQHHKIRYAHDLPETPTLLEAVKLVKPTVLIGVAGIGGTFTEAVVKEMVKINNKTKPMIFALSNPTKKCECTAEQAFKWSNGHIVFATGSPSPDVTLNGQTHKIGQGNNAYIFPGVGMGVMLSQAKFVTDRMFYKAALELSQQVSQRELNSGLIYPAMNRIRDVSKAVAVAVMEEAFASGLAQIERPRDLGRFVDDHFYCALKLQGGL